MPLRATNIARGVACSPAARAPRYVLSPEPQAQSRVSPTQAQVLFATTPLWSAAIAMVLLPAEHLSLLEGVGGALIVVATVLVTRA